MSTLIADLLPPKVRAWIYALLFPINAAFVAVLAWGPELLTRVYGVALAVVNAAGFTLARANTPDSA